MKYLVTVRADYPWQTARVGGIVFHQQSPVQLTDAELTGEIRTSPLLDVRQAPAPVDPAPRVADLSTDKDAEDEDNGGAGEEGEDEGEAGGGTEDEAPAPEQPRRARRMARRKPGGA